MRNFSGFEEKMRLHLGISRERCAPWGTKDAAHGASDNELIIRRGLELHEPSRTPLDRSCLLSPSCPTFVLFGFFLDFRVENSQEIGFARFFLRRGHAGARGFFLFERCARMRGLVDALQLADGYLRVYLRAL